MLTRLLPTETIYSTLIVGTELLPSMSHKQVYLKKFVGGCREGVNHPAPIPPPDGVLARNF